MRFRPSDAVAFAAPPLVVVAFVAGGTIFPTVCLCLAGAAVVFAIASRGELAWQRKFALYAVAVIVDVALLSYLYKVNLAKELRQRSAPLVAATLPPPVSSNCPIPKGAVALYLGNITSVVTAFPHVVFKVRGDDVLVIDRDSSGLLVSFVVFDDGGNLVARLDNNRLIARNPASRVERPDASHLSVFDAQDTEVLGVQFLNPQAVRITGILRYPQVDPIVIREKYLGTSGSISPPACKTGPGADFSVD
jgi:hypothetical protein